MAVVAPLAHDAIAHPLDDDLVAIVGDAGTGKTTALLERAKHALVSLREGEHTIVSAASSLSAERLRRALEHEAIAGRLATGALGDIAFAILSRFRFALRGSPDIALIDDARAEELFTAQATSLFALEWDEFLSAELDPEVTGLRAPERFAATSYRLIRKLRIAAIEPQEFVQCSLRGATRFYGKPPNFANPDLLEATPAKYRDSLNVDAAELSRQHAREVDLAKVLGRLYEAYLHRLSESGCMTRVDALVEAARLIETRDDVRIDCRRKYRFAFVDDAQDLTRCDVRFLEALFGKALHGVTVAGDVQQRTRAFAGPRGDALLERAQRRYTLTTQRRSVPAVVACAEGVRSAAAVDHNGDVVVRRFDTMAAEAAYVADGVTRAIAQGTLPSDIAVIARSLRCVDPYLRALLDRDIAIDVAGEGSLYAFRDAEDALAALWALADPLRHDWLLRNLEAPWLALSDASIAVLCSEAPDAQTPLFQLESEAEPERGRRWDRRRDFRLAWNVLRGDRDAGLQGSARERLAAFRDARRSWQAQARRLSVRAQARRVLADTVLAGDLWSARGRLRRGIVERLLAEIDAFVAARPRATLHDYLLHAEHAASADDDLLCVAPHDPQAVAVLGVEAAKGREFRHVFVVDVRAGAFPRYYVPDAFQFSTSAGMIPKENVGDAVTATRTAKFTYFQYRLDVKKRYYAEERRALQCAITRARERVSVSASGRPTRGMGAPEFLEELRTRV